MIVFLFLGSMLFAAPGNLEKEFFKEIKKFRENFGDSKLLRECEEAWGTHGECAIFNSEEFKRWNKYYRACEKGNGFFDKCKCRLLYKGSEKKTKQVEARRVLAFSIQKAANRAIAVDPEKRKEEIRHSEFLEKYRKLDH